MGVIAGLESLKEPSDVRVVTDSHYVIKGIRDGWAAAWKARGWRTARRTPARNVDLWQRLLDLTERHAVTWEWVRGHAGHPENERCDQLANAAALGSDLEIDEGFEQREAQLPLE